MLRSVVRTSNDERGAVLIITALLVPALVLCGALAFGVTTLWTGEQDAQRATDLGALAGAAALPTAVSPELPIDGTVLFQSLGGNALDATDWRQRACEVTRRQFLEGRSPVATGLRADSTPPSCTVKYQWESPLLATLAACADDVAELGGCRAGLERELRRSLPAVAALDSTARSAIATVGAALPPEAKVLGAELAAQLRTACVKATSVTILGQTSTVCNATVGDLLSSVDQTTGDLRGTVSPLLQTLIGPLRQSAAGGLLDATTGGLGFDPTNVPQVGVKLRRVAPALLTPRVHVDIDGLTMKPTLSPFTFDVASGTTARRVFKSAVVLPAMGIPGTSAWVQLPAEVQSALADVLGSDAQALLAQAEGGWVVDPNVLTRSAPATARQVLDMYDATEQQVSTAASGSLCTALGATAPTVSCPVGDQLVNRDHLLGPFMEDLWDVSRPPPEGDEPRIEDVLAAAADSGEQILVASGLREVSLATIFGPTVWQTIKATNPAMSSLLAELLFVPALDVVPATIHRDGTTYRIEPVLATTGLYKARLVK